MAESSPHRDTGEDPGVGVGREPAPRTPRWVKIGAAIALVVVLLFVVLLIAGGPDRHGPGRHFGGDAPPDRATPPAGVTEGHKPPAWVPDHGQP